MPKNSFFNSILNNTRLPQGIWGRIILSGMNCGHSPLSRWGLSFLQWKADWNVLDIGCGGGANIARMLRHCPDGIVCGLDASQESVDYARRKNRKLLDKRCFIRLGNVRQMPYKDNTFDVVTAFETIYFWDDLAACFAEVFRILRPHGKFLICCEASDPSDTTWTDRIAGMRVYAPDTITLTLSQAGFSHYALHSRRGAVCIIAEKDGQPLQHAL